MTKILKEKEKCDLIICLSHLGHSYKNELKIGSLKYWAEAAGLLIKSNSVKSSLIEIYVVPSGSMET